MIAAKCVMWDGAQVYIADHHVGPPGEGQVVMRMDSLGLCSSDFHIWEGRKRGKTGILGHEGAGTVMEAGPGSGEWNSGDRAVVSPLLNCGDCLDCAQGRGQICATREIVGYNGRGLLATFQLVEQRCLLRAPASLEPRLGALVEPLACVLHGLELLEGVGGIVVVLGAGPMGVLNAAAARTLGARAVLLVDPDPDRLALAGQSGAEADEYLPFDAVPERISALTGGRGADVAIIANSSRAGHESAFRLAAGGGKVLGFASIIDQPGPLVFDEETLDTDELHRQEAKRAIRCGGRRVGFVGAIGFDSAGFERSAQWLAERPHVGRMVTRTVALNEVPGLIGGAWRRDIKILVEPHAA
jgi:L-iditol 2-dehydrogenase